MELNINANRNAYKACYGIKGYSGLGEKNENRNKKSVYLFFLYFLTFLVIMLFSGMGYAHEAWVLTPEQFAEWNAKPRPEIFTTFTSTNIFLSTIALLFVLAIIWLDRRVQSSGARGMMERLSPYHAYATVGVRWSLAIMIGMAAFGLSPRHGTELMEASTLVAPDLEIRLLHGSWQWLAWVEALATITLILGVYVRVTAFFVLLIDIVGLFVFGYKMFAYAGIVGGVATYLLIAGAGKYAIKLPTLNILRPISDWLRHQPISRAQFLMRVLAGVNLLYLGVEYKFFQPNLSMAFIGMGHVFTFGFEPATFVFCMFLIETIAGVLMVLGMMMRPLSIVLFIAFMFLSYALNENPLGHIIFYGILWACFINGSGRWSEKKAETVAAANDDAGRIGFSLPLLVTARRIQNLFKS